MEFLRRWWAKTKNSYKELLRSADSSNRIAHGIALGVMLDFLPIPFISIPFSYVLARLLRINAPAATLTVVFLKWAVPFFFLANIYIGSLLLGGEPSMPPSHLPWYRYTIMVFQCMGSPFLVGMVINATVAWTVTYLGIRRLLAMYRHRWAK
ncbi:MAG: DUF2062 domain-containing protein [Firmicutes bacterium]|nr:DUF2062 domain-containing protein [Bacillota bacterium]